MYRVADHVLSMMTEEKKQRTLCCVCKGLLSQPVQLVCLHNCCRSCLDTIAMKDEAGGKTSLVCNACEYVTQVDSLSELREQNFIATQIQELSSRKVQSTCDACLLRDGGKAKISSHWCPECKKLLCPKCLQLHQLFNKNHHPLPTSPDDGAKEMVVDIGHACATHNQEFRYFCARCSDLKCAICVQSCREAEHDVKPRNSDWVSDRIQRADGSLRAARALLRAKVVHVERCSKLCDDLAATCKRDFEKLKSNRRLALEAVNGAYKKAEGLLQNLYTELDSQASEVVDQAKSIRSRANFTLAYADALLNTMDATNILRQEKPLLSCLQSLVDDIYRLGELEGKTLVVIDFSKPNDFEAIIQSAVGLPRLATDTIRPKKSYSIPVQASSPTIQRTPSWSPSKSMHHPTKSSATFTTFTEPEAAPGSSSQINQDKEQANVFNSRPSLLGHGSQRPDPSQLKTPAASGMSVNCGGRDTQRPSESLASFSGGPRCRDIAVTDDLRVLVADGTLKEYDISGKLLRECAPRQVPEDLTNVAACAWQNSYQVDPSAKCDKVFTVDVMTKGVLVAGLYSSKRLSLIKYGPRASWAADNCFKVPSQPARLRVSGNLCAVACSNKPATSTVLASTVVYLVSLVNGEVLLNVAVGFEISSLLLSQRAVVVSSEAKQWMKDGSQPWVMDAYSHKGARLWRYEAYEEVTGLCIRPVDGNILYVSPHNSNRISVVSAINGQALKPILSNYRGLASPWLLFISSNSKQPVLAVVSSGDDHTVTIYSADIIT